MTTSSQLLLLGTLGALSAGVAGNAQAQVDTSAWKCESCPFEVGTSGTVDVGVGHLSDASARFGDFTGLRRQGAYAAVGADLRARDADGMFGNFSASNLGLNSRALSASGGREGSYSLRLGYDELPHYLSDTAMTPFLGGGTGQLTLPAGFPGATTGAMPLAGTLQGADLAYKRRRLELGATVLTDLDWSFRIGMSHRVREGTQRSAGSFFTNAAQLVAPVDQTTDEIEASASYAARGWSATLSYLGSIFRNADSSLTWSNPFTVPPLLGPAGLRGQLALAPDNASHQLQASVAYQISPIARASADIALGRMTQNDAFLAPTLNGTLLVPGLPAASLHGRVNTLNANLRLTVTPTDRLRLNASLARNEHDNQTPVGLYPTVSTDLFVGPARSNQPYSFSQDQLKLGVDYRGDGSLKLAAGVDYDARHRTLQEVATTRETTLYARASAQAMDNLSLALKVAHADRGKTDYGIAVWVTPAENPLLRKYNMATRRRDTAAARADWTVSEGVSLGVDADLAYDDYPSSPIGLTDGQNVGIGADMAFALSEQTQLTMFARSDRLRSRQTGSQVFAQPDWSARNTDTTRLLGLGVRHAAIKDKLDIGADIAFIRSASTVVVDTGASGPLFPRATTAVDSLKVFATYRLREDLTLTGSFWHERYAARDWQLDGGLPATVANLLAFGEQAPRHQVNVLQLVLRYRF